MQLMDSACASASFLIGAALLFLSFIVSNDFGLASVSFLGGFCFFCLGFYWAGNAHEKLLAENSADRLYRLRSIEGELNGVREFQGQMVLEVCSLLGVDPNHDSESLDSVYEFVYDGCPIGELLEIVDDESFCNTKE